MLLNKTLLSRFYFILIFIQYVIPVEAQTGFFSELYNVEHIPSKCMNKSHKAMVFLPDKYYDTRIVFLLFTFCMDIAVILTTGTVKNQICRNMPPSLILL